MSEGRVSLCSFIVARREPRCSFLVKFGGGGGDFFSGALRLSVTTPRQPFGLVLRSTRAPPKKYVFSTFHYLYLVLYLLKNTKIMEVHNYSCILPYSMIYRQMYFPRFYCTLLYIILQYCNIKVTICNIIVMYCTVQNNTVL